MFQFAYYRYLQTLGYEMKFDIYSPSSKSHNGFELFKIFPNIPKSNVLPYIKARPYFLYGDILKKIFKINKTTDGGNDVLNPVITPDKVWLRGFWQTYKYMNAINDRLLADFTFVPFSDSRNIETAKEIMSSESVSIHVRRGDYLKPRIRIVSGNICTTEYYNEAISIIKEKVANPRFFVFSNDIEWVKQNLDIPEAVYVNNNNNENSFRDMQLMSLCKHNIIANSSFSWWGAWLNRNSGKVVIAPKKWFHNESVCSADLIPDNWYKAGKDNPNITLIIPRADSYMDYILQQSYFDFELLTNTVSKDARVKPVCSKFLGNIVFSVTDDELPNFKNRNYLKNKLLKDIDRIQ